MFYVIEISEISGKISPAIYPYNNDRDAVATFHSKMGGAMRNDSYSSELVMVVDEYGRSLRSERYVKPVAEE